MSVTVSPFDMTAREGEELLAKTASEFERIGSCSKRGSRRASLLARRIHVWPDASTSGEIPRDDYEDDEGHHQEDAAGQRLVRCVDYSPERVACGVKDPADHVREATADRSQQPVHRKSVQAPSTASGTNMAPDNGRAGRPVGTKPPRK